MKRTHKQTRRMRRYTNKKFKKGGSSKIVLIEENDIDIFNSILNDNEFQGKEHLSSFIKNVVPTNISSKLSIGETQSKVKKTDKELLHDIAFVLYPFMLNVFNTIDRMSRETPEKYDTQRKRQQIFALKTIRKIDLVKKPVWLESLVSYMKYIVGMGGNTMDSLESMIYNDDLTDTGKQGAKIEMNVYKSNANDRKINNPNCKDDNEYVTNYNIKYYNADPIKDANHALNSIYFQDIINSKYGYSSEAAKGLPIITHMDELLLGNIPK